MNLPQQAAVLAALLKSGFTITLEPKGSKIGIEIKGPGMYTGKPVDSLHDAIGFAAAVVQGLPATNAKAMEAAIFDNDCQYPPRVVPPDELAVTALLDAATNARREKDPRKAVFFESLAEVVNHPPSSHLYNRVDVLPYNGHRIKVGKEGIPECMDCRAKGMGALSETCAATNGGGN